NKEKYMGTSGRGAQAVSKLHFPVVHAQGAQWIATRRDIKIMGLDTASLDYGASTHFRSHLSRLQDGNEALEHGGNVDKLPPSGFTVVALPMKTEDGSGGPVRIIARL